MNDSHDTETIRKRMEKIRCDLDEDVQDIVEGARDLGQWRYYVKTYPWICVGAAVAAGYFIVPRRTVGSQSDASTRADPATQSRVFVTPNSPPQGGGSSVRGALLTFVGNLVLRSALKFVGQQAGKLFAPQTAKSQQDDQP